jgi:hypothetical protein
LSAINDSANDSDFATGWRTGAKAVATRHNARHGS